jgi:hypothetical protein
VTCLCQEPRNAEGSGECPAMNFVVMPTSSAGKCLVIDFVGGPCQGYKRPDMILLMQTTLLQLLPGPLAGRTTVDHCIYLSGLIQKMYLLYFCTG